MKDLIKRLLEHGMPNYSAIAELCEEAAKEIERLRRVAGAARPEAVYGECADCGQTVVTPLKNLPDAVRDAERYRWIRANARHIEIHTHTQLFGCRGEDELDRVVDTARGPQSRSET